MWPSLTPPGADPQAAETPFPKLTNRIFVTIAASDGTLPPIERFNTIYPRYLEAGMGTEPGGLTLRSFRDGTPYQNEDLLYDHRDPASFLVRCTRDGASSPMVGMCLYEKRIGDADITARFPRAWLSDWVSVTRGLQQLIANLRSSGGGN
jgi:hypothetical protein